MKEQMLIELSFGAGDALHLWERMCVRLHDEVLLIGSLQDVLSFFETAGFVTGEGEGEYRVYMITESGTKKAKMCQYAILCAARWRITW